MSFKELFDVKVLLKKSSSLSESRAMVAGFSSCFLCGKGVLGALFVTVKTLTACPSGLVVTAWITLA